MAIRRSYSPDCIPDVVAGLGLSPEHTYEELPSQRGSALLLRLENQRSIVKIADTTNHVTEAEINPPRSVGITNESHILSTTQTPVAPRVEATYTKGSLVATRLEYLYGRTWNTLAATERLSSISHALGAITTLHESGISHGDIHPSNILTEEDGDGVKLLDFELATPLGTRITHIGKVEYASTQTIRSLLAGNYPTATEYDDLVGIAGTILTSLSGEDSPYLFYGRDLTYDNKLLQKAHGDSHGYRSIPRELSGEATLLVDLLNRQAHKRSPVTELQDTLQAALSGIELKLAA